MQQMTVSGRPAITARRFETYRKTRLFTRLVGFITAALVVLALLPVPEAVAADVTTLKVGMSGSAVKTLQSHLVKRGYLKSADGKFGSGTQKAVKLFQKHAGVSQDGVAGAKTQSILYGLTGSAKTNLSLKLKSKNSNVNLLQRRLGALGYLRVSKYDNSYGPVTKAAVVQFQKEVGLKADGVAGPATLLKLYSSSAPKYLTKGEKVLEYAKKFLGVKYVYAKANPTVGFDCSGLVWYVYKHFGVTVSRSAKSMVSFGTKVEGGLSKAKPGDILCFGNSISTVGHVGLYVGGGKFLHAPQTGEVVKIETLSQKRIDTCVAVRRVFTGD